MFNRQLTAIPDEELGDNIRSTKQRVGFTNDDSKSLNSGNTIINETQVVPESMFSKQLIVTEETSPKSILKKQQSWFKKIFYERTCHGIILFIVLAATVPLLVYYLMNDVIEFPEIENYTCLAQESYRVPCGKINISAASCLSKGCCTDDNITSNACYHYLPSKYSFQSVDSVTYYTNKRTSPYGQLSLTEMKLSYSEIDANRLKITLHEPSADIEDTIIREEVNYKVDKFNKSLAIEVFRTSGELLLTTSRGPLIASPSYWEWTFQLSTDYLFGLGELSFNTNETITKVIYKNKDDHNTLPIFLAYSNSNNGFHGVSVDHDGPLEVSVLPSNVVILRSLAGSKIVLNLSVGPTIKDVSDHLRGEFFIPPQWMLRPHICRGGINDLDSAIKEYQDFQNDDIIYESDCFHENLLFMAYQQDDLSTLKSVLESRKNKFLLSIPPQVPIDIDLYKNAIELDILHKNSTGDVFIGTYLNQQVAYIDYDSKLINDWVDLLLLKINTFIDTEMIDGFIFTDNWPAEETYKLENIDYFSYFNEDLAVSMSHTIPWDVNNSASQQHITRHNKYGSSQITAFNNNPQLTNKLFITANSEYGYPNPNIIQNVNISWINLKKSITNNLYNGLFGKPFVSTPICGSTSYYNKETHEPLCIRWYLMAATMPMLRVSSELPRRDPNSLFSKHAQNIVKDALAKRDMLLPYYNTILNKKEVVNRPMFYEFHLDNKTFSLDEQYMIGEGLLVVQPVYQEANYVPVYFPNTSLVWYEFWGGYLYEESGWQSIHIVESDWIMFIKSGSIVPLKMDNENFNLAIACNKQNCTGNGDLHFNINGLTFIANETGLTISNLIEVQSEIDCLSTQFKYPHIIKSLNIYKDDGIVMKAINYDICEPSEDSVTVSL